MGIKNERRSPSITRDVARKRCENTIANAFEHNSPVLVDALPAMGKSSGVIRWAARTENPLLIFTARHDLYQQYEEWCREYDLTHHRLESFHHDCPCLDKEGKYGDEWRSKLLAEYRRGRSAVNLHEKSKSIFGKELPCQESGSCPYMELKETPVGNCDVLIGHYTHAYRQDLCEDRYVVLDEFPEEAFFTKFTRNVVSSAITTYLDTQDDLPFEDFTDLERNRWHQSREEAVDKWVDSQDRWSATDLSSLNRGNRLANVRGPLLTLAMLKMDSLKNRWGHAKLPGGRIAVESRSTQAMTIFDPPRLEKAIQVIALDGTPQLQKWQLILGEDLVHSETLTDSEKDDYLHNGLGLRLVQTTVEEKPYASGQHVTADQDMALLEAIKAREGKAPALITSKRAIEQYELLELPTVVEKHAHYNDLKGTNKFKHVRLGVVIGTPRLGDGEIERWAALFGKSVEIAKDSDGNRIGGRNTDFGEFGNIFLRSFREDRVLQAVLRFGREEKDGIRGATVYVHTGSLPKWVSTVREIATIHPWIHGKNDGLKQVIKAIQRREDWKTGEWRSDEIAEDVSINVQQVRDHLKNNLAGYGYIGLKARGRGGTHYWYNICMENIGNFGHVSFSSPSGGSSWDSVTMTAS